MSIGIITLKKHKSGNIQVFTTRGVIDEVPRNLVECALGENDSCYLLRSRCNESLTFGVTESEYKDFLHYRK